MQVSIFASDIDRSEKCKPSGPEAKGRNRASGEFDVQAPAGVVTAVCLASPPTPCPDHGPAFRELAPLPDRNRLELSLTGYVYASSDRHSRPAQRWQVRPVQSDLRPAKSAGREWTRNDSGPSLRPGGVAR